MVGKKFTVCQYCKKFSSSKKSFLWRRWSTAEGQLIFPFRFYGPKMCQCFKISHTFAAHFSLGLGRCKWGISIEMMSCDKRFPSTQIWFSSAFAPPLFRGIARPTLDWLMTSLSHCISHQEIDSFWNTSALLEWRLFVFFAWGHGHELVFIIPVWGYCSQVHSCWMMNVSWRRGNLQQSRNSDEKNEEEEEEEKHFKIKWMNDECLFGIR